MKVQCTNCESKYNIKDEKIPDAGADIKCPKCQNVISVSKPELELSSLSSEDLIADLGNESDKTDSKNERKSKTKKCLYCAEEINADAIKCKHCNSDLVENKSIATKKNSGELFGILMLICPLLAAFLIWFIPKLLVGHGNFELFSIIIILSAIIITAILAAIEANQLNFGNSDTKKSETGPIGFFLGILMMWVISYPFYLYKRGTRGKKNLLAGGILVAIVFLASISFNVYSFAAGSNTIIPIVKNGKLLGHQEKTVGDAIESALTEVQWSVIKGTDGNTYVNANGILVAGYDDSEIIPVAVQFRIDKDNNTFEINTVEAENRGLPASEVPYFLNIIYNIEKFRAESACSMFEAESSTVMAWIADYLADPSNVNIPTIEDLKTRGYEPSLPVEIHGDPSDDIYVLVIDSKGKCPKGKSYVASFEMGGKWTNYINFSRKSPQ